MEETNYITVTLMHLLDSQGNNSRRTNSAVFPVSVAVKLWIGRHFLMYGKTKLSQNN